MPRQFELRRNWIINFEIKLLCTPHVIRIKCRLMEQMFVILAVLAAAAVALYCVRLLDRAWPVMKKRRARRPADSHEEIKLPGRRKGN